MEENERITKIIVNSEDELTDIVSGIINSKTERIILTFTENSDILISSINLAVIKETAEEEKKLLICQIIKNPSGERNAKLAGILTIDTPNNPTDDQWEEAKTVSVPQKPEAIIEEEVKVVPQPTPKVVNGASDFEKRINDAIQKSRVDIERKKDQKTINEDGLVISVGEDLPIEEQVRPAQIDEQESNENFVDLSKIDFNNITGEAPKKIKEPFKLPNLGNLLPKSNKVKPQVSTNISPVRAKFRKLLPILLISILFITALVGVIYFNTVPFVKVRIFVKAQDVNIEQIFTGDSNIKEIDFTNFKIPIKTESLEESRSSSITATGVAYKGDKASGSVALTHPGPSSSCVALNLPAGQVVTSSDGKTYTLDSAATIQCNSYVTATVHATDIGEEYNTSSSYFTVQNYSTSDVFGYKSGDFSGGSKTQYTVLSLADVNTATDSLKTSSITDITDQLKSKQGTDWTIITDSVKADVKADSIKTDVAVGAAATQANLTLTITGTATYYLSNGFDSGVAALLTSKAQAANLFQSSQNLELTLGDNIEKNVSVVQSTGDSVLIKLTAKGTVQPKIDKAALVTKLQGMNWADGTNYLEGLSYSDKATVYEFNPVNFPKNFKYFPKRQGGVLIEIVNI